MPRKKDNEIYSYKLKSGKIKYGFKTYIGIDKETGKSVKVTRQGFNTRKEAEQEKYRLKVEGGTKVNRKRKQSKNSKTVDDIWNIFYESQQLTLRPSTLVRNESVYKYHIEPEFGNSYINYINIDHLQKWVNDCAKNYVKYRMIVNLMKRLIGLAIYKGYATKNPFDRIIIPKKGKAAKKDSKDNYLELDELKDFLATAKTVSPQVYTFFMTSAYLGLRRGEALAIQWDDIDFDNKIAHISRTVTIDEADKKKIGPTKTRDKYRKINGIPIAEKLLDVLKEYKKYEGENNNPFLFHTATGEFYNTAIVQNWLQAIYRKNPNLKRITAHGLRHTLASLLFETNSNISVSDVQYMLGHKDSKTTLDIYTTVTKKQKKNLRNSINDLKI